MKLEPLNVSPNPWNIAPQVVCSNSFMMEFVLLIVSERKDTIMTSECEELRDWYIVGVRGAVDGLRRYIESWPLDAWSEIIKRNIDVGE